MNFPLQLEKRGYPVYLIPAVYLLFSLFFRDRWAYCAAAILTVALFLASYSLGQWLSLHLFRIADQVFYFPIGLGVLLIACYAVFSVSTSPLVVRGAWTVIVLLGISHVRLLTYRLRLSYLAAAPFVLLGFWSSFTPLASYDALANQLGMPHQYLAAGKMSVLPDQLYSAFPPLNHVLNLLYAGVQLETGIKTFAILVYFQIAAVLVFLVRWIEAGQAVNAARGDRPIATDVRTELLVVGILLVPTAWIQVHYTSPILLATLFFSAGVVYLIKESDFIVFRRLLNAALLLALSGWTHPDMALYLGFLWVLWFSLTGWRFGRPLWKSLGQLYGMILLFLLPLFVRNALALGDPVYPALHGILHDRYWSVPQTTALAGDALRGNIPGFLELVVAPFRLSVTRFSYGPASEIGLLFVLCLLVYIFAPKRQLINRALLYTLACFLAWLAVFQHFTPFFPVLVLVSPVIYISMRFIHWRFPRYAVGVWVLAGLFSLYLMVPYYVALPLIRPDQSRSEYLRKNLDYFPMAEYLAGGSWNGRIAALGETRLAYFKQPLVTGGVYNLNPFLSELRKSRDETDLYGRLTHAGIRYMLYNQKSFLRYSSTYRNWDVNESQMRVMADFLARYTSEAKRVDGVALLQLRDSGE